MEARTDRSMSYARGMALQRMDNVGIIVEDLAPAIAFEEVLSRLRALGAELIGEVTQYEDKYRLCYARAPRGS